MQGLKVAILEELEVLKLVVQSGEEIIPLWRIMTPTDSYGVFTIMRPDRAHRMGLLGMMKTMMIWRKAYGFVLSAEMKTPDAITSTALKQDGSVLIGYQAIESRDPVKFAPVQWLGREHLDPILGDLIPSPNDSLTKAQTAECEKHFGDGGIFEGSRKLH